MGHQAAQGALPCPWNRNGTLRNQALAKVTSTQFGRARCNDETSLGEYQKEKAKDQRL